MFAAWAACSMCSTDGVRITSVGGEAGMGGCTWIAGVMAGARLLAEPQAVDAEEEDGCACDGVPSPAHASCGGAHAAAIIVRSAKSCFVLEPTCVATALSTRELVDMSARTASMPVLSWSRQ